MHGLYLVRSAGDIEETRAEFREFVADCFDENNWWQEVAALTKDGEAKVLAPSGDWRGRDKEGEMIVKKGYNWLVNELSWGILTADIEMCASTIKEDVSEVAEKVKEIMEKLEKLRDKSEVLDKVDELIQLSKRGKGTFVEHARALLRDIAAYLEASENPPFTYRRDRGIAYRYRLYDLSPDKEAKTILVVDVHI